MKMIWQYAKKFKPRKTKTQQSKSPRLGQWLLDRRIGTDQFAGLDID